MEVMRAVGILDAHGQRLRLLDNGDPVQDAGLECKSLKKISEDAWRNLDPANLPARRAADLVALARAEVEVLAASHFTQTCRELIRPGRTMAIMFLYAPVKGNIRFQAGNKSWEVTSSEIVLIPGGTPHGATLLSRRLEVVGIHMSIRLENATPNQALFANMLHHIERPDFWHAQLETLASLHRDPANAPAEAMLIRHLLASLVMNGASLRPIARDLDPRVARAMELMKQRIETPLSVDQLGRDVGLSSNRLRVLFRRQMGMTPKAYHKNLRMEEVLRLLRQPHLSIKEIAAHLAYTDSQHLEKDFKAEFGIPPGRFRSTAGTCQPPVGNVC